MPKGRAYHQRSGKKKTEVHKGKGKGTAGAGRSSRNDPASMGRGPRGTTTGMSKHKTNAGHPAKQHMGKKGTPPIGRGPRHISA